MATHQEMARRVERILQGRFDVANLDRIFLWLRSRSYGHASIRDLGDFVAHSDERTMGRAWQHSSDLYTGIRHGLNLITKGQGTTADLVSNLRANMRLEDPADAKKYLRMGQRAAHRIVESLVPRIENFDGRKLKLRGNVSYADAKVLNYYASRIRVTPAYTQQSLLSDFAEVLYRNKLMSQKDDRVGAVSDHLAIYTISKMHLCEVTYENAPPVSLRAGWKGDENGPLSVSAVSESIDDIQVAVTLFETGCVAKEWCTKRLLTSRNALRNPIEVSTKWRLRPVA